VQSKDAAAVSDPDTAQGASVNAFVNSESSLKTLVKFKFQASAAARQAFVLTLREKSAAGPAILSNASLPAAVQIHGARPPSSLQATSRDRSTLS
jgi:hypothetical protein